MGLRFILLGVGALLIAGIWWWGARHSRRAGGPSANRESVSEVFPEQTLDAADTAADSREWSVSPFEPVPVVELPMTAYDVAPVVELGHPEVAAAELPAPAVVTGGGSGPLATFAPPKSNVSETQRIVTLRVCAVGEARWPGTELMDALDRRGLAYGRYQVFHRKHVDGRTLFCAASLVEPGTFDLARMQEEEFRGLTLFAVLPGPAEPLQTFDALLAAAGELAADLQAELQDAQGAPLTLRKAESLREDVARYEAFLAVS